MGWYMLAAPGTDAGPCKEECKHLDCAAVKKRAGTPCVICGEPIGYETKMYFLSTVSENPEKMSHALCEWKKLEK